MTSTSTTDAIIRPFVLGLATGARTTAGITAVALTGRRAGSVSGLLTSTWGKRLVCAGCVGELVGDKLPKTPSRLEGPGFIGRVLAAAASGVALAERDGSDVVASAGITVAGAFLWTVLGAGARKAATTRGWSDLPVALLEDLTAAAFAFVGAAAARDQA